jgi:hypothetical protein
MSSMLQLNTIGLFAAVTLFKATSAINACPVDDTLFTGAGGIRYRICPDSDLVGPSTSVTPNVASTAACAQLCDKTMNCFKAVYDTRTRQCHVKGQGNLKWGVNAQFDVIQAEQINIARCPYEETAFSNAGVSHTLSTKDVTRANVNLRETSRCACTLIFAVLPRKLSRALQVQSTAPSVVRKSLHATKLFSITQ